MLRLCSRKGQKQVKVHSERRAEPIPKLAIDRATDRMVTRSSNARYGL